MRGARRSSREIFCFFAKLWPFFLRRARETCLVRRGNRTITFRVKQFRPMGAGNLTRPIHRAALRHARLRGKLVFGSSMLGGALCSYIITIEAGPPGLVRPQAVEGVEPGNRHAAKVGSQLLDETLVYLQA